MVASDQTLTHFLTVVISTEMLIKSFRVLHFSAALGWIFFDVLRAGLCILGHVP